MAGRPTHSRCQRPGTIHRARLALAALLVACSALPAYATHFRYGHITYQPRPDIGARTFDFTVQNVWRRDAYGPGGAHCVNTSFQTVNCTGPGGFAGVGDIIHETVGGTTLDFGDGTTTFGKTIGGQKALLYYITSIDPVNNWAFGLALDHNSLPTIDTTITHTYSNTSIRTAKISDCCRILACSSPNAHLNNPDNGYQVATTVDPSNMTDSSPVSSVPPIVECPENGDCSFTVPYSDNEGDAVSFRLATNAEMNVTEIGSFTTLPGLGQPGPPACPTPNSSSVDGNGDYSWNTTGCRLASSAGAPQNPPPAGGCNDGSLHSYYSSQVVIQENSKQANSAVDFLIELAPFCPGFDSHSPQFIQPPLCGTARAVNPGSALSLVVEATDSDANDSDTLNAVGIPAGATMSPGLPTSGIPVSSTFSWTPTNADVGDHLVTFTATDSCGLQTLCPINISVTAANCPGDCSDPRCLGTPCDDHLFCTSNETCHIVNGVGSCSGGTPTCDDHNACTADSCNEAGQRCINDPAPMENTSCNDGNPCTTADACHAGACNGITNACDDNNPCTADSCDANSGQCSHDSTTLNGTSCSDGNPCTSGDTCANGSCSGTTVSCDDGNPCTVDSCDANTGQCVHDTMTLNGTSCNDGNPCTTGDTCSAGVCGGTAVTCNDGNPCTADSCDPNTGQCVFDRMAQNGASCDDGNPCTSGDTCSNGACAGTTVTCDDNNPCTADSCDANTGHCINDPLPLDGTMCDDGLYCTVLDSCQGGVCTGQARDCSDGNLCTADSCDEANQRCVNPAGPASSCNSAGRGNLTIKNASNPKQDRLVWRWTRGALSSTDIGDPVNSDTQYALCVYDESAGGSTTSLALSAIVAPGGMCNGKSCWKASGGDASRRVRYKNKDATGLRKLSVKSGSGMAKAVFVAKGDLLPSLPAPVSSTQMFADDDRVRVQLLNSDGTCVEADYNAPATRNRSDLFRDKCGAGTQSPCE